MKKRYVPRGTNGKRDRRGWYDPRTSHRKMIGHICKCDAYRFPHMMFTARCKPQTWVELYYEQRNPDCEDCRNRDGHECQVVTQQEPAFQCPALLELVRFEAITLYGRAREAYERVKGDGQMRRHAF